jgi:hypothetical protein
MRWIALLQLILVGGFVFAAEAPVLDDAQTRAEIENFAGRLPYLSLDAVLYRRLEDRIVEQSVPEKYREHRAVFEKLQNTTYSTTTLLELLRSPSARVRTVAAVALFEREDPHTLPALVELARDQERTFDDFMPVSIPLFFREGKLEQPQIELPIKEQTVGCIATRMVQFYMEPAGFYYGIDDKDERGFSSYWVARKDRTYCASWFAVQLARACGGTSPTPAESLPRIRALRNRINAVPADDRTWTLLLLHGESGSDALVTEQELIDLCRALGPQKLLLMLQRNTPSNDPDLRARENGHWPYSRAMQFVLKRAKTLKCAMIERNPKERRTSNPLISAWWAVAAATLQPENGREILLAAIQGFDASHYAQDRSLLHAALWQTAGEKETDFILKWFFSEETERGSSSTGRSEFIRNVANEASGKVILAQIIEDPKFDQIEWQALEALVRVTNAWSKTPIVSEDELRAPSHPFGLLHFDASAKEAEEKYPKETQDLRRILGDWRQRLRNTAKTWRAH